MCAHLQCTELIVRHVGKQGRLSSTAGALCVLRRRQQRLLRCFGTKRRSVQALGRAAAAAKTRHRLHELGDLT
jgi:hypothetical protein